MLSFYKYQWNLCIRLTMALAFGVLLYTTYNFMMLNKKKPNFIHLNKVRKIRAVPHCDDVKVKCTGPSPEKFFNYSTEPMDMESFRKLHPGIEYGGSWTPDCSTSKSTSPIALIVTYMDREKHLQNFIQNIVRFLKTQKTAFTIFLVQQVGQQVFNRGLLSNIGFIEARKLANYSCFIFHDVDMIPVNLCNLYTCSTNEVTHLGVSRNLTHPTIFYEKGLAAVFAINDKLFKKINGFSNIFFGWGGEDDNIQQRLKMENIHISRPKPIVGNYFHQPHPSLKNTRYNLDNMIPMAVMLNNSKFKHLDGVTTVRYKLHIRIKQPLFTRIIVSFPGPTEPEYAKKHFLQKTKQLKFLSVNFHRNSRNVML